MIAPIVRELVKKVYSLATSSHRFRPDGNVIHPSVRDEFSARDFLRNAEFSPERASEMFPNARGIMLGGLFISHSGGDSSRIDEQIISPVVFRRLPGDGYFMHSRLSGGAESYKLLVHAALHWCDKFMVVISQQSISNAWVLAEVEWALEHRRPVLAVRFDDCEWKDFMHALGSLYDSMSFVQVFDFRSNLKIAQQELGYALDALLAKLPRGEITSG
jgi:TIR domain